MSLPTMIEHFHFLRPLWLLAIIPAALLTLYFWRQKSSAANWRGAINENLLNHLIEAGSSKVSRWPWLLLFVIWLVSAIAIAGPSWTKLPQPVHQRQDALVIVLDLSLSMLAQDVKPSRLIRARHKVLDILKQRNEGLSALIAYAGDAHIVSPLTDDNPTIANLVPALAPDMMPAYGSDPIAALQLARQLFKNAGVNNGRILLITDNITTGDVDDISNSLRHAGFELSILGIGTTDGAPIPAKQGFLKDNSGNIIVPKLNRPPLEQLAKLNDGRYTDVSLNDNDIQFLLPVLPTELDETTVLTEREFDQWYDRGPLLTLLLLPLALVAFRRGWLLALPFFMIINPPSAQALEWQDLWQRPDQQASKVLEQGDPKTAATLFQNQQWQGTANYQAGDFESAVNNFSQTDTADAHYNRGNALAKAGKLDDAIAAYDKALQQQPDMEDAQFNKQLLEQLKQQQQQQQDQQSNEQGSEQDSEQQDSEQNNAEQQNSDQNSSEQQNQQQQDSEQQNNNQASKNQGDESEQSPDTQNQQTEQEQSEQEQSEQEQSQQEKQQQQAAQQQEKEQQEEQSEQQATATQAEADPLSEQKKQAMEQWLRQIPDDPSGLLRRKFNYEHRLRQQQGKPQREQPPW